MSLNRISFEDAADRYQLKRCRMMKEGKDTIQELLNLIESSDESLKMSNDYLNNVLSRIKNETIPAAYSAGRGGCKGFKGQIFR